MFKVGLDLPELVREPAAGQKKRKKTPEVPLSGNDLQSMLNELKSEPKRAKTSKDTKGEKTESIEKNAPKAKEQTNAPTKNKKNAKKSNETVDTVPDVKEVSKDTPKPKDKNASKSKDASKSKESPKSKQAPKDKPAPPSKPLGKNLTPLQLKMQQKLSGARFRWINEQLYTQDSQHSYEIFQKQPEVFKEYHDGFRHQVEQWPENPVRSFVEQFKERSLKPVNAPGGLPGSKAGGKGGRVVVADMGCGEAELALELGRLSKDTRGRRAVQFEVHSFDLHKANDRITVADIAHVPLPDESCDVAVFCLALMGTNLADFINEAIRILKPNGLVWIAEIKSRFPENDYSAFVETLKEMGLYHRTTDDSNRMFVKFEFVKLPHKLARARSRNPTIDLRPCIYKRR